MKKLKQNLLSVKVWGMAIATALLVTQYIGADHWVVITAGLTGGRVVSTWQRRSLTGGKDSA